MNLQDVDIWKFLAGLGLFLFGLSLLENALRVLAGPTFRKVLRDSTKTSVRSTVVGTVATAILQSSSVVNLILLAFVGAGILSLRNALGVVYGSNFGTTFTGWIVTYFGFKVDFGAVTLPLVAVGGLVITYFRKEARTHQLGLVALGFGILLLGLASMKDSVEALASSTDVTFLQDYSIWAFLVFGIIFTAIIQSSSAAMIVTLSSLSAGLIDIYQGAAIVIGADLGTTGTVIIGAIGADSAKKRVALSHLLYNIATVILAFAALYPLLSLIRNTLGVTDNLYSLVLFHSAFNFVPILLFLPITGWFAKFLENRFVEDQVPDVVSIGQVPTDVPEAAIAAASRDGERLLEMVVENNLAILGKRRPSKSLFPPGANEQSKYERIKTTESKIVQYLRDVQKSVLTDQDSQKIVVLLDMIRHGTLAAKNFKDVKDNIKDFTQMTDKEIKEIMSEIVSSVTTLMTSLKDLPEDEAARFEVLAELKAKTLTSHKLFQDRFYKKRAFEEDRIRSTGLNLNWEIRSSCLNLLSAFASQHLSITRLEDFERLPVT